MNIPIDSIRAHLADYNDRNAPTDHTGHLLNAMELADRCFGEIAVLVGAVDRLQAALAKTEPQPIATAPKDGKEVMDLWDSDGCRYTNAYWGKHPVPTKGCEEDQMVCWRADVTGYPLDDITHWMYAPEPAVSDSIPQEDATAGE